MFHDRDGMLRPFSRWRLPPGEGEPAHGYFARLVADEEHTSCAVYGKEIGADGRYFDPASLLDVILRLPLPEAWRRSLIRATPVKQGGSVHLGGEVLGRRQWSNARRRYCPACLAEDPVHRTWWDVLAVTRCHVHDVAIRDVGPDGRPIGWWWPSIDTGPDGQALAEPAPPPGSGVRSFNAYIVGRLGYATRIDAPLLDDEELGVAIAWVEHLGGLLADDRATPHTQRSLVHDTGFAAYSGGQEALVETVRDWVRRNPPSDRRRGGLETAYGSRLGTFPRRVHGVLASRTWDALETAIAKSSGRGSRSGSGGAAIIHSRVTVREIALTIGMPSTGVSAIAAHLGLECSTVRWREPTYYDVDAVARISVAAAQLVSHAEAARLAGLKPPEFGRLAEAGLIRRFFGTIEGYRGPRYLSGEIASLIDASRRCAGADRSAGLVGLNLYCRLVGRRTGDVIVDVLEGRLSPADARAGRRGFRGLRFVEPLSRDPEAVGPAARPIADSLTSETGPAPIESDAPIPIGVAARLLQVTQSTVKELERRGDLRRHPSRISSRVLFDAASVRHCIRRFAVPGVYLEILGGPLRTITGRLRAMGAAPVVAPSRRSDLSVLFERAEVRRLLGLSKEPDSPGSSIREVFWRQLTSRIALRCPQFLTPEVVLSDSITLKTSSMVAAVKISMDVSKASAGMTLQCSEKASGRRWKIYANYRSEIRSELHDMAWQEDRVSATATLLVEMSPEGAEAIASCMERVANLFTASRVRRSASG